MCDFTSPYFSVVTAEDMFGISVIDSAPITVDGMYSSGKVIPIAIPNRATACSLV